MENIANIWMAQHSSSHPLACVPHSHIWIDWGLKHYAPQVIDGSDFDVYQLMRQEKLASIPTCFKARPFNKK